MSAADLSAPGDWFTHPAFDDTTEEITFSTAKGPVRCPVVERVFCAPEGVRLHQAFERAAPPAEAREILRRQKIAELRAQVAALGLSADDLLVAGQDAPEAPSAPAVPSLPAAAPVGREASPRTPTGGRRAPGARRSSGTRGR